MLRKNGKHAPWDISKEVQLNNAYEGKKVKSINKRLSFLNYDIFLQYNILNLYLFTWKIYMDSVTWKRQVATQCASIFL